MTIPIYWIVARRLQIKNKVAAVQKAVQKLLGCCCAAPLIRCDR